MQKHENKTKENNLLINKVIALMSNQLIKFIIKIESNNLFKKKKLYEVKITFYSQSTTGFIVSNAN